MCGAFIERYLDGILTNMSAKTSWIVVITFILLGLVSGCSSENEQNWDKVVHEQYEFQIIYPIRWIAETYGESGWRGNEEVKLTISQRIITDMNIQIKRRPIENPSIEDVVNWSNERFESESDDYWGRKRREVEDFLFEEVLIDSYYSIRRRYIHGAAEGIKFEEILIPRENDMLIISYMVDEDHFNQPYDEFEKIYESFQTVSDD